MSCDGPCRFEPPSSVKLIALADCATQQYAAVAFVWLPTVVARWVRLLQLIPDKSMGKAVKRRRALETVEDTLRRQAQNRTRMASMRASETHEQTLRRQGQGRICTASMIIMAGLNACGLQSKLLITPLSE